ncbi:acyl-CoA dehydrogenase family protein [Thermodesulfobacteriota bacterium]
MIELNDDLKLIRNQSRKFVDREMIPREMEIAEADAVPGDIVAQLRELCYFGIKTPVEYGGLGLGMVAYCLVQQEFARTHPAINLIISGNNSIGTMGIVNDGTEEQKKQYLPKLASGEWIAALALTEPEAGSDASAITTKAEEKGGQWVINGMKHFITRGDIADVYTVMAVNDKEKRTRGGITAFIVEKGAPGLKIGRIQKSMGSDTVKQCEIYFENCKVTIKNVIGEVGYGFRVVMKVLEDGRIGLGARSLGSAQRLLELSTEWAKMRVQFGKPISERQSIQWMLADMAGNIYATECMVYDAAQRKDAGEKLPREAAIVKLFASEMAFRAADNALQIHGGMGYMKESPVEFFFREIRLLRIIEGTSEIQRMLISRDILKD